MARTVADAAILLGVLEGQGPDPNDAATARCDRQVGSRTGSPSVTSGRYSESLDPHALMGARIGIPRAFFYDEIKVPGREKPTGGISKDQRAVMDEAIGILKAQGAVIVDPADIPSVLAPAVDDNLVAWGVCAGTSGAMGQDAGCSVVFKYGMKRDFNAWLTSLGGSAPIKTLTELRLWNLAHTQAGSLKYGQSNLDISDEMDLERDKSRYEADRAKDIRLAGTNGIDAAMATHNLDALLFPGASGAAIAARPGYPTVIVPFASVPNAPTPKFPDGFDARPAPFGIAFAARACSEPRLIALAYAFEQATRRRVPPPGVQ
jgi:amidase